MILIFAKAEMNFCKNDQNATILKIIEVSKIATADLYDPKFFSSHSLQRKSVIQLYTYLFKTLKDLNPMLGGCSFLNSLNFQTHVTTRSYSYVPIL